MIQATGAIRVEFFELDGRYLYDADLGVLPQEGEQITFPSSREWKVVGPPRWRIGETPIDHRVTVTVEPVRDVVARRHRESIA